MTANPREEFLTLSIDMGEASGPDIVELPPYGGVVKGADRPAETPPPALTLQQQSQRRVQLAHRASMLNKAGRNEELEQVLEELLQIDPKDSQALYNLAVLAHKKDEKARAERYLRSAIAADPDYSEPYQMLGDMYYQARHLLSAIESYEKGLAQLPTRLPLLASLLRACYMMRSLPRVESVSRRILNIDDRHTEGLNALAWAILRGNGDAAEAAGYLDRALALKADNAGSLALLEHLELRRGDQAAAEVQATRINEIAKDSWASTALAADTFISVNRAERAANVVRTYLEYHPDDPSAHRYLAVTLMQDGDFAGGQKVLEQVLAIVPDRPNLQMVYCLNAFRLNDIETFYKFHHTRWQREGSEPVWDLPVPDWDGKPIKQGKLVVQSEQGVGDYVMFAVCFPGLRPLARDVIVKTMGRLARLFQRSFPDMQIVPDLNLPYGSPVESVAAKTTAGDLPFLLGGDIEHLPGKGGVLVADPATKLKLRRKYETMFPGKRLIGISWRSGNRDSAAMRSLELPHWKPIFDNADCAFISLQYGDISQDIAELKKQLGDHVYWDRDVNPMGEMDPFAAQVSAMDLVISVDNSTIHFAGGLGKPCWAMLPLNSDWRWQVERNDTVWYDSLELFRPEKEGGWEGLVETVAKRLASVDDAALKAAETAYLHRALDTMMKADRTSEAEQYGRLLLMTGEHKAQAMRAVARSALAMSQYADATGILQRAVEIDPADPGIVSDLAVAIAKTGEPERGLELAREVTRRFPKSDDASTACGQILSDLRRYDEATDFFARVLRRDAANVRSRIALAGLQAVQGDWDLARQNYRRTLEYDPGNAPAHIALAEMDLRLGRWTEGWENFRWRYNARPGILPPHLSQIEPEKQPKRWTGGSLRRPRLLLAAERNIIEQVLMSAFLPEVVKESRRVTMECSRRLVPLMARSFPGVEVVPNGELDEAGLDARQIQMISSLGELAARFRGEAAQFPPRPKPYLTAKPERVAELRRRYQESFPGRRLIGLSWRGHQSTAKGVLERWLPLIDRPDCVVVALSPDGEQPDLSQFAATTGRDLIYDRHLDFSTDFDDYAAQIGACDTVVAAEDLTAVLAAAGGKPVVKLRKPVDHWWLGAEPGPNVWFPDLVSLVATEEPDEATVQRAVEIVAGRP